MLAAALLAGTGLAALTTPAALAALVMVTAPALPGQLALRVPGGVMRSAATTLAAHERPGDAIVCPGGGIPTWPSPSGWIEPGHAASQDRCAPAPGGP
jgi:hypothetical protein